MTHTRTTGRLGLVVGALLSAACASTPTGPSVLVLPGSGKSHDQFRAEDVRCRQRAAVELQTTERGVVSAQRRYDMVYIQCMYTEGNQVPVAGSDWRPPAPAPTTRPADVPPPPAGAPPPPPAGPGR